MPPLRLKRLKLRLKKNCRDCSTAVLTAPMLNAGGPMRCIYRLCGAQNPGQRAAGWVPTRYDQSASAVRLGWIPSDTAATLADRPLPVFTGAGALGRSR